VQGGITRLTREGRVRYARSTSPEPRWPSHSSNPDLNSRGSPEEKTEEAVRRKGGGPETNHRRRKQGHLYSTPLLLGRDLVGRGQFVCDGRFETSKWPHGKGKTGRDFRRGGKRKGGEIVSYPRLGDETSHLPSSCVLRGKTGDREDTSRIF